MAKKTSNQVMFNMNEKQFYSFFQILFNPKESDELKLAKHKTLQFLAEKVCSNKNNRMEQSVLQDNVNEICDELIRCGTEREVESVREKIILLKEMNTKE